MGRPPLALGMYRMVADLVAPLAYRQVRGKLTAHGIAEQRLPERKGAATLPRPTGRLMWFHSASVGESLSALPLITRLGHDHPDWSFLITSGTGSSARILSDRLPDRTQHQFAPLDSRRFMRRFLTHWRPDAAVFVESELWPNMLGETARADVPLALVNARISDSSARNWSRFAGVARHLMRDFRLIHCQDTRTANHLTRLGLDQAQVGANLKAMAVPPPVDPDALARVQKQIGDRPVWLAASTHPGEDQIVIAAQKRLLLTRPDVLLVLVPRHTERAADIQALLDDAGLTTSVRSKGGVPDATTQTYLADTFGETGLWYALAPITCLCGSFSKVGGHNPYEPAQLNSAILHGPHYSNFASIYPAFDTAGAADEVRSDKELASKVAILLDTPDELRTMQKAALDMVTSQDAALGELARSLAHSLMKNQKKKT